MNKPVSAKCFSMHNGRISLDLAHFEAPEKIKLEKRGVDCRVSRREREIPNTFGPITELHLALANPFLRRKNNSDSRNNFTLRIFFLENYFF